MLSIAQRLYLSLANPHPESRYLADEGLEEWSRILPDEDPEALLNPAAGKWIQWVPGKGWVEDER